MSIQLIKQSHNINYVKTNIIDTINNIVKTKTHSYLNDIIVPECFSIYAKSDSKFAKTLFELYPTLQINLDMYRHNSPKQYGTTQFVVLHNENNKNFGKIIFANMICVRHNRYKRSLDYILLSQCMLDVARYINNNYIGKADHKPQIMCTKFGAGKIGGNWLLIEQMIQDCWDICHTEVCLGHA